MFPLPLEISGYRSLTEPVTLPFKRKLTIIAGANNSGKSNILRALAILFNKNTEKIDDASDFAGDKKYAVVTTQISKDYALPLLTGHPFAEKSFRNIGNSCVTGEFQMAKSGLSFKLLNQNLPSHVAQYIEQSQWVLSDFGRSGDRNLGQLERVLTPEGHLKGTTYVPNIRFITQAGQEPPSFVNNAFPGITIAFGKVIDQLAEMDRPSSDIAAKRQQLSRICDFMAYCLDKGSVSIEVPANRSTIRVNIDGEERALGNLGTGVEQLLMIGLAAIGFPGKLVLIDEPELHLHPTSQRRIIRYLAEQVDAQFVVSTHSAAILDTVESDIVHVVHGKSGSVSRNVASRGEKYLAVRDLGHSPSELVQTRFAVWVEGPSDRIYINNWLRRYDAQLVEGVDYSVLFYGGSVLSQHSFTDDDVDLVRALSMSRSFAVVIDSDRTPEKPNLRKTKIRVRDEVETQGGYCWITEGREIENYISTTTIRTLAMEFSYASVPIDKRAQILDPATASKTKFAHRAVELDDGTWPLDLVKHVGELVLRIRAAK